MNAVKCHAAIFSDPVYNEVLSVGTSADAEKRKLIERTVSSEPRQRVAKKE